jgi:hypothetical protein
VIDETLLMERMIVRMTDSDDGLGFDVRLSCGHEVWHPQRPGTRMLCALCLEMLVEQVREVQRGSQQVPVQ